jgi:hydrogenase maturation factor HypF (carbamoyltransferase family)
MPVNIGTSFELILGQKGYKPFMYDLASKKWIPAKGDYPSSMDLVRVSWRKHAEDCNSFETGLNERGMPPTLIYPRPVISDENKVIKIYRDFQMSRIFEKFTNEQIYDSIVNRCALIVNDVNEIINDHAKA